MTLLARVKESKTKRLSKAVTVYIESRYSRPVQASLMFAHQEAIVEEWPNRIVLVQSAFDWIKTILAEYWARKGAIAAATDTEEVGDVSESFTAFDGTDPDVTLEAALSTEN